jgi:hypothetical protein
MIENVFDLLPIGSVVLLENGIKPLMIFGVVQHSDHPPYSTYDYVGVPYPEGNLGEDYQYLFDHASINEVLVHGPESPDRQEFLAKLEKFIAEAKEEAGFEQAQASDEDDADQEMVDAFDGD